MKKLFIYLPCLLIFNFIALSQNDKDPDFVYNKLSDIESSSYFSAEVSPIRSFLVGDHVSFGLGLRASVNDFKNKFNFDGDFSINYGNGTITNRRDVGLSADGDDSFSTNTEFRFNLGYTFSHQRKTREKYNFTLEKKGNVEVVSEIPVKIIRSLQANIGFYGQPLLTHSQFDAVYTVGNTTYSLENNNVIYTRQTTGISLGFKSVRMLNSTINTDKYGRKTNSLFNEFMAELLIGLNTDLPETLFFTEDSNVELNDDLFSQFNNRFFSSIPVGLRLSGSFSSVNEHSWGWGYFLAYYPGTLNGTEGNMHLHLDNTVLGLKIFYRFNKKL